MIDCSLLRLTAAAAALAVSAAAPAAEPEAYGVLVMAHGGGGEWNDGVLEAVEPLRDDYVLEVAFGMADAASLQAGVAALEARGAARIGVVRLFVSRDSFRERTEQVLGLAPGAPPRPAEPAADAAGGERTSMAFWRIDTDAELALGDEGLSEAPEVGPVLLTRARSLSRDPRREDVLVLAHGPGEDAENARWLEHMNRQAETIRRSEPFHAVRVATLREDWPDKRAAALDEVRAFVAASSAAGRTPIVIPYRVHGFGPYAEALEGLEYVANERGLLPHPAITDWIARQAEQLRRATFHKPLDRVAAQ